MQPFPTIQNYGYQPGFGMYNPMAPYQERLAQLQSQFGSGQYQNQQQFGLNGEIVDSIDVVKAKNVDMSGNVTIYPKSDLSEIYTKRLTQNGTSQIDVYVRKEPVAEKQEVPSQSVTLDMMNTMFDQLKKDLSWEINGLKDMVGAIIVQKPSEPVKPARGGKTDNV